MEESKVQMPDVTFYLLQAHKKDFPDMYFVKIMLLNTFKEHTMLLYQMFRQKSDSLKLREVLDKNQMTFDMAVGCLKALGQSEMEPLRDVKQAKSVELAK